MANSGGRTGSGGVGSVATGRCTARLAAFVVILAAGAAPLPAQEAAEREIVGSWQGALEPPGGATLRLVFHVERDSAGALSATMDSPDQGVTDIAVSETVVSGDSVRFAIASIGGTFEGEWSADGTQIDGVWQQGGASLPLVLTPGTVEPPARPLEPDPPFPYDAEDVRFPNREAGIELAGTLTLPRSPGPDADGDCHIPPPDFVMTLTGTGGLI